MYFPHEDPPLWKNIEWMLKQTRYLIHLLIKDGSANLSCSSVYSFHQRYTNSFSNVGYKLDVLIMFRGTADSCITRVFSVNRATMLVKGCALAGCPNGSINLGAERFDPMCCNTDLCNGQAPGIALYFLSAFYRAFNNKYIKHWCWNQPCKESKSMFPPVDLSTNTLNGKMCYYCNGESCSKLLKLNCSGSEDRCITATGENLEKEEGSLSYSLLCLHIWFRSHIPVANLTLTQTVFFFNIFISDFERPVTGCQRLCL